jgi:hypothetical protein
MLSFNSKKHLRHHHLSIARIVSDDGARETQDKNRAQKIEIFSINNSYVDNSKVNSPRKKTMDEASILSDLKKSVKIKQIKLKER